MTSPLPPLDDEEFRTLATRAWDGGIGTLATEGGNLPLRSVDVRGRIDGLLAQVRLRQSFVNPGGGPVEATYIFPLPDRASVTSFRVTIAGRLVEGLLEERGKARATYDQAIRRGHRAAITEEERPGVFTLRVGNLMPGEDATVEFEMAGLLPFADGEATFRFPLVVAPRYIPGAPLDGPSVGDGVAVDTDAVPDASRITPPVLLPGFPNPVRLSLEIDLHDGPARVDDVRSSLHSVVEERHPGVRSIRLDPGERLDRDFVLRFRLGGESLRSSLLLRPDPAGDEGTFALTLIPPDRSSAGIPDRPRDVAFVVDRSGSMEGWKIVAATRAVARMIETLTEADRFGLLAFSTGLEWPPGFADGLHAADDHRRYLASSYLHALTAGGGTEMARPLGWAAGWFAEPAAGPPRDRVLVLVTDGQVGNEDEIVRSLGPQLQGVRVFALGIDQAVNGGFLRRLADLGGGSCELVESAERLDAVMDGFHRQIGPPILTGLRIEPNGLDIEPDTLLPDRLPGLHPGSPLILQGRYRGGPRGPVILRATDAAGATWSEEVAPLVRDNPAITTTWARGMVRLLEDRYVLGDGAQTGLEARIVATSLRFGVLCRFTAYVAVDRTRVADEGGELHRITQPVEAPKREGGLDSGMMASPSIPMYDVPSGAPRRALARRILRPRAPMEEMQELREPSHDPMDEAGIYWASPGGAGTGPAPAAPSPSFPEKKPRPPVPTGPPAPPLPPTLTATAAADQPAPEGGPPASDGIDWREPIGLGGLGTVYRAFDHRSGRELAIQLLPLRNDDPGSLEAIRAEAAAIMAFRHPAWVPLLEIRVEGRWLLLIRPLVAGRALDQLVRESGPFDPARAAELVAEIGEIADRWHGEGRLLGPFSTGDIWIGGDGAIQMMIRPRGPSLPGEIVGRPVARAPELIRGQSPSVRGEVYALGVILYELLTGRPPFEAGSVVDLLMAVLAGKATPPGTIRRGIPRGLEAICRKAIAPEPAARYATMGEFVAALRAFPAPKRSRFAFWK